MVSACKCTGSMKFLHVNCVKAWIALKLQKQTADHVLSYYWKSFCCEICKTVYPCTIPRSPNHK